jgi:branched-chain amino acid transport system permease protein
MILDALILLLFGERPRSILPGLKHFLAIEGLRVSVEQIVLILAALILLGAVAYVLHRTPLGRQIRASVQHSEAARSLGISSAILHRLVFIGSGVLAAAGGIAIGIDQSLTSTLGFPMTIKAYAALIAGGKDNFWATIACAYFLAMLEQFAVGVPWVFGSYLPASYQSVVALLAIIVILIFKPSGLFSRSSRIA